MAAEQDSERQEASPQRWRLLIVAAPSFRLAPFFLIRPRF
jgi:hypothetical protein